MRSASDFNRAGVGKFPGYLGLEILSVEKREVRARMPVVPQLLAPNGYLHAGSVVTLADTCAGYGCVVNLPEGAAGFTTVELKSNHLSTALEGVLLAVATPVHLGRTTQVWDATVTHEQSGKTLALFRCTQLVLWPKPGSSKDPQGL